ncbi:LON peptidase substrate-binding domain-containing protein [Salinimicrobium sp. MT39]|uniref:LON peptidase substrate-binding domain-containing protein n=1 Tax=Salinimicrobium profundisediminis TaxID=2994553 RepID=A0A9X3D0H3_9FLAO|nr:LON peptidase substrate-binding domain-containing protein [Salinimicrobium profundisediminis]MCX2839004.1 LON peptidase substrate-binding domain-containing protein [Salinimicrobium profundisediminis]
MKSRLALFPLQSVVFPGEVLPLHIFEPRYKELIDDCESTGIKFGIPTYIENNLEYGTEMELIETVRRYESGARDIICKGARVFRVLEFAHNEAGKMYAGGDVEFLPDKDDASQTLKEQLLNLIFELYVHLEVPRPKIDIPNFRSYTLAHKIGLPLQQEYTLLKLTSEKERQEFLINHLTITIPILQEMNRAKQVIELNGHFRNYDPLDFQEFRLRTKN